ncbi:MAG TPA: hypothetical protein VJ837_05615, partial [Candidatus Paceibacterota bacterium]|nr:hypothetical protein [Candidatus Paceibacterota bacterium]
NIMAPGTYTLTLSARHGATGQTGTTSEQTVVVTQPEVVPPPPPEEDPEEPAPCLAAPSVATQYLKELGIKAGGRTHKNIVAAVAQQMGPQKSFNGTDACAMPAYGNAVKTFVDGLVG